MKLNKMIWIGAVMTLTLVSGCKKFLNVEPIDSLSGNNFWRSHNDVETFTREMYRLLRDGFVVQKPLIMMGDLRMAPVVGPTFPPRGDFNLLARNDIRSLVSRPRGQGNTETWWQAYAEWDEMGNWTPLYQIIQAANILYEEAPVVVDFDPSYSSNQAQRYQAEAVYVRCLVYFYLLRMFGDVPYYTQAYHNEPLPRTSHVVVAQRCLEDLAAIRDVLPWTYPDPANRAVRAMKGSVLALEINLNMWLAGFDEANQRSYYESVDGLAMELIQEGEEREGAYELLPLRQLPTVFIGRSKEGLFEIPQNVNYGDRLGNRLKVAYTSVLHYPYFTQHQNVNQSELAYFSSFMEQLYPIGMIDGRKTIWFYPEGEEANIQPGHEYSGDTPFSFFKYFNFAAASGNDQNTISNYFIIFRLADVILMHAEALEELGETDRAIAQLNRIRGRAGAPLYPADPGDAILRDAIFLERCKELMLEGKYFYDVVRTHRAYDPESVPFPMTYSQFLAGAWTWPIHAKALNNNPHMRLNDYWN